MILTLIGTVLTTLLPVLALLAKDYAERRKAEAAKEAPLKRQGEVDAELVSDTPAFAVRLSRLHEILRARRRAAERPDPRPRV